MQSHSVNISPLDSRCRYWAKVLRAGTPLPFPAEVDGASDVPGPYARCGTDELLPGDALLEGEANHHKRTDRGWTYWLQVVRPDGHLVSLTSGFGAQRAQLKKAGMPPEMLQGSGDVAAMVRIIHGVRAGMSVSAA